MDKSGKTITWLSAFMALVVLTSSFYILLPEQVRIDVEKTRTKFSVYEDNWVLAATEYYYLFDGSKKMRASSRTLTYETEGDITIIKRFATYKDDISTIHTYVFDSSVIDVVNVPVDEYAECFNCQGKIVHFEYRDITYSGETEEISSPFSFGHNMKIEWQDGAYFKKVYQQKYAPDKAIIKYRPIESHETYHIRLFDPKTKSKVILHTVCLDYEQYEKRIYIENKTDRIEKASRCIRREELVTINKNNYSFRSLFMNCKKSKDGVICDSTLDGNGDGVCIQGESCLIFNNQKREQSEIGYLGRTMRLKIK